MGERVFMERVPREEAPQVVVRNPNESYLSITFFSAVAFFTLSLIFFICFLVADSDAAFKYYFLFCLCCFFVSVFAFSCLARPRGPRFPEPGQRIRPAREREPYRVRFQRPPRY